MSTYLIKYTKKVGTRAIETQVNLPSDDYVIPYVMRNLEAVKIYSVIDVADIQDRHDTGAKWDSEKLGQYIDLWESDQERKEQDTLAQQAIEEAEKAEAEAAAAAAAAEAEGDQASDSEKSE